MIAQVLFALAILVPAGLAALVLVPGWRRAVARWAVAAPLPALVVAVAPPAGADATPSVLLLGLRLGSDGLTPIFLAAVALVWTAAAWQALRDRDLIDGPGGRLFLLSLMAALSGAAGAALALEPVGFYFFFTVMTLAAYGLIVSAGPQALWAGRLFIALALVGEMAMLAGFMIAAATAPAAAGLTIALLFYFGMGTKHAVLPMHAWLPPAHGTAPPAASALLSGPILNTGVLAWLRFLPLAGDDGMSALVPLMVAGGLAAAFLGAFAGIVQYKPKVVLAYSSVSQMGILTTATAFAVAVPDTTWPVVGAVIALFAFHHAVTKGALFLSVQADRDGPGGRWVFPAQVVLSLSIAGFALTGGGLVKLWLDKAAAGLPNDVGDPWLTVAGLLLPLAAVASALLMARFLWLVRPGTAPAVSHLTPAAPVLVLTVVALVGPWVVAALTHRAPLDTLAPAALWKTAWPVLVGGTVALAVVALVRRPMPHLVPNGDVAVWLGRLAAVVRQRLAGWSVAGKRRRAVSVLRWAERVVEGGIDALDRGAERGDALARDMSVLGIAAVGLALGLVVLLLLL